jgi:predicted permease
MNALRLFLRSLRRHPLAAGISIVTLGIGVGLTTSMAGVMKALLFQLAPFRAPQQLYRVESVAANGARSDLSVPEIEAVRGALGAEDAAIPFRWIDAILAEPGSPAERHVAVATTGSFFRDLGVPALLGRTYQPADVTAPDAPVVVLGHDFWQRRFGGDPAVVGRTIRLNGHAVTVLGVMPPSFDYRRLWAFADLWLPGTFMEDARNQFEARQHALVVRLPAADGAAGIQARLAVVAERLAREHPVAGQGRRFALRALHTSTVDPAFRRLTWVALGVCGVVLLIVCVNLASLQLARALAQEHEVSVRAALGASRRRLVTARLVDSALLGVIGGAAGLVVAWWCNAALESSVTVGLAGRLKLSLDPAIFLLALGLAVGASLAAGAAPALLTARIDLNSALRAGGRGTTGSRRRSLRQALIVGEIALAVALVSASVLLFRNLRKFTDRTVGWNPAGVVFGTVSLPPQGYETPAARQRFHDDLQRQLAAQPAISGAALSSLPPIYSYWVTRNFRAEGRTAPTDAVQVFDVLVSPDYFDTLGVPFHHGRGFERNRGADAASAVVINEALARALWPGEDALGRRLVGADGTTAFEVIGVVSDVDFPASLEKPVTPFQVYEPFARDPWGYITVAVRGPGRSADLAAALRAAVAQVDPAVPVHDVTDVPADLAQRLGNLRLALRSLAAFAGVGLGLALLGIYGTVAHEVAQRRREVGIRLALGAAPRQMTTLMVRQGARMVAAGLIIGVAAALASARLLALVLGRAAAPDPLALTLVCAAVTGATLLACWLPARAAARIDPLLTLRAD